MAITFNKKSWKSRISEHPTRRRLTIVDASLSYSLVDVAREEGTVEQVGDTFDKSTMDDLENRIEAGFTSAQDTVDDLQEQIDEMPSLDDTKTIDIGWKESGTSNTASDTIRVNPFEVYSGTVGTGYIPPVEGSTSQQGTPTPSNPVDIVGVGVKQQDDTYSVTVGNVTASGLAYPLYEGDVLDFVNGKVIRATGYKTLDGSENWVSPVSTTYSLLMEDMMSGYAQVGFSNRFLRNSASNTIRFGTNNKYLSILNVDINGVTDLATWKTWLSNNETYIVYPLAEPVEETVTITGVNKVITGFIPSAKFFQIGRKFCQETPVKNWSEGLNSYYKGMVLNVTNDAFITEEPVDTSRVNEIRTMYAYDYDNEQFLASVAGEIYTSTGSISCDLRVTDIWGCGANGQHQYHEDTSIPVDLPNRLLTNSNGFPIELTPVNQSDVSSLVVGSPVSFRITGELYILLWMGVTLTEYVNGMHLSKFYKFVPWNDTRDGVHYSTHYINIEKGTTFNLSDETTLINYHFLQCYIRGNQSSDPRDYLEWTVTDSNVAITAKASATGYGTGLILEVDHRRDGDETGDYDTHETIIINVVAGS